MGDECLGTLRRSGKAGFKIDAEKLSVPPPGTAGKFDATDLLSDEL